MTNQSLPVLDVEYAEAQENLQEALDRVAEAREALDQYYKDQEATKDSPIS